MLKLSCCFSQPE